MNLNSHPLVTIITPVYNGADYLDDLIKSVQSQDYSSIEHIIIDDGSNDNGESLRILSKYSHIRWWTRPNKGQYATMNEGLHEAKGEIVCFISADDIMCPDAVSKAVGFLNYYNESIGVFGYYGFINSEGEKLNLFHPLRKMPLNQHPYSLHISHSSFYVRKKVLIQNNLFFDSYLKYVGDYQWIVRLLKSQLVFGKINDSLSMIRIHSLQTSKTSFYKMREEMLIVQNELNISYYKASFFRKIWFFINLINSIKIFGVKRSLRNIQDRFKFIFQVKN